MTDARAGGRLATARRFAGALGPTAAALGIQFLAFALTARGLGAGQFGQYAALQGLAAMCAELVGLGGADLLVRAVARDQRRFQAYFGNMLALIAITLVPVIVLAFGAAMIGGGAAIAPIFVLLGLAAEILVSRVGSSIELVMVAHGHVVRASLVRLATPLARLAAVLAYFHSHHALEGWILAVLVQAVLVSAGCIGFAMAAYGLPARGLLTGEWKAGSAFMVNQFARAAQSNLDRVVLSFFAAPAMLGVYSAGSRVLQLGLFPLQIMTRILYPQFFVHGAKGVAETRRFALRNLPTMLGTGVLAAAMVAGAGLLAPSVLGGEFARTARTAMLLSLSLPLIALQYLAADILTGAGYQQLRATIYAVTALGFGVALALGARLGGADGLIAAYLLAHGALAGILWVAAFALERPRAVAAA